MTLIQCSQKTSNPIEGGELNTSERRGKKQTEQMEKTNGEEGKIKLCGGKKQGEAIRWLGLISKDLKVDG